MDKDKEEEDCYHVQLVPKADWFTKIISFQADIIYNCIMTLLSPFITFFSVASQSHQLVQEATATVESAVLQIPSKLTHGSTMLLRKIVFGILGAVQVCLVLIMVMLFAVFLGVGFVQLWVEEPVLLRERLFFDYTDVNPKALFTFGGGFDGTINKKQIMRIPVGHTFHVSLLLLMPESDYNRQIGVFQLTAEVLSDNGNLLAKSSQPCMLRFRSLPIRLIRTLLMGLPLILGISEETQKISIEMLKRKEGYPRTKDIKFTMIPRAGTSYLPQLYEAEILMKSQLPWMKEVVRSWKWTFYVWASLYIFIILLIILICCCRSLVFPMTIANFGYSGRTEKGFISEEIKEPRAETRDEKEISELLRKWQERRKRKAIFCHEKRVETMCSLAPSMSVTMEDSCLVAGDQDDSESVCLDG